MNSIDSALPSKHTALPGEASLGLNILSRLRGGALTVKLPDDSEFLLGEGPQRGELAVRDLSMFEQTFSRGDIGFAESYIRGEWDTDDLAGLLTLLADNRAVIEKALYGNWWRLIAYRLHHLFRSNTVLGPIVQIGQKTAGDRNHQQTKSHDGRLDQLAWLKDAGARSYDRFCRCIRSLDGFLAWCTRAFGH